MRKILLLVTVLCLAVSNSFAQGFQASLIGFIDELDETCAGGAPLDGSYTVKIYWDNDNNGPDDDDPQPVTGSGFAQVNYNQFPMGGEFGDGYFGGADLQDWFCTSTVPSPNRYYLRICLLGAEHWRSDTFSVVAGFQSIFFGTGYESLTCLSSACPGCASPAAIQGFAAHDTCYNAPVRLSWTAYADPSQTDSFEISRGGPVIAMLADTATRYIDNSAPNNTVAYQIRARKNCGGGNFGFSNPAPTQCEHFAPLLPPTIDSVSSSFCDTVRVYFHTPISIAGITGYRVKRNGIQVADSVGAGGASTARQVRAHVTDSGSGTFTIVAYGPQCGEGTVSNGVLGTAFHSPPQVTNVQATDSLCTETVTWNDVAGEDGYHIYRAVSPTPPTTLVGTVAAGVTIFVDGGAAANTVYLYKVNGYSASCGDGPNSGTDIGFRIGIPSSPSSVTALDSAFCTHTAITWTDNSNSETSYEVLRDAVVIATLPANPGTGAMSYNDSTGVAGQTYSYNARVVNPCGNNSGVANNGSKKSVPTQSATTTATDALPSFVTVSWGTIAYEARIGVLRNGALLPAADSLAPNVVTFNDSTAAAGLRYLYQVRGFNECGDGVVSLGDSGGVLAALSAPYNLTATDNTSCAGVTISWSDSNSAELFFAVLRDGILLPAGDSLPVNSTTFDDLTGVAGQTYSYTARAYNGSGNGPISNADAGTRKAVPAAPVLQIPVVLTVGCDTICFSWDAVPGADDYVLFKDGLPVDTIVGTSVCYAPGDDNSHNYTLTARNSCGSSAVSNTVAQATNVAPAVPVITAATSVDCQTVLVTWTEGAGTDDVIVFRTGTPVDTVLAGVLQSTDSPGPGSWTYTLIARNECGSSALSTGMGANVAAPPSVPTNLTASTNSCLSIELDWDVSSGNVDTYHIYRDNVFLTFLAHPTSSFSDETATDGNHDYFIIALGGACANSANSDTVTGTRLPSTGTPAGVSATDDRCANIEICWTAALGTVDSYVIYRGTDSVGTSVITCFVDTPAPGTYSYTVKAFSAACGYGAVSNADDGTRVTQSTAPTTFTATDDRCDGVLVTWTPASGSFSSYHLLRNGTPVYNSVDTFFLDLGADLGDNEYKLFTEQINFDCSNSDTVITNGIKLPSATVPQNFVASDTSCTAVYMSWSSATGTFTHYNIYEDAVLIDQVPASDTTFAYESATPGGTQSYEVAAFDAVCGETSHSNSDDGTRVEGPNPPTNLTASSDDCETVHLAWTASAGDLSNYRVFRDDDQIGTISSAFTAFDDSFATAGVTHVYSVTAVSTFCGETLPSDTAEGMILPPMAQVQNLTASSDQCAGVVLNWDDVAGADLYRIYRDGSLSPYDSVGVVIFLSTYTDTGTVFGDDHSYEVTAVNACGEGAVSDAAVGAKAALPDQVQGVTASDTICGEVCITWTDLDGESFYIIYVETEPLDTVPANTIEFCDTTGDIGVTYDYSVAAMNGCGTGPQSASDAGISIQSLDQVTGIVATTLNCDSVHVTWTDISGETGYRIDRDGSFLANAIGNATSYWDNTAVAGGCYLYKVTGFNLCGSGPEGSEVQGCRRTIPTVADTITATTTNCDSVIVDWAGIVDADNIHVIRDGADHVTLPGNATHYVDTGTTPGSPNNYSVFGINTCGAADTSAVVVGVRANTPTQVLSVVASSNHCFQITVTWADLLVEAGYRVYRDDNPVPIANLTANTTTYIDTPRVGAYHYTVRGFNDCGEGALSVAAFGEGLTVPSQVTGASDSVHCGVVTVFWGGLGGISGYRIYRVGSPDVLVGTNPPNDSNIDESPGTGTWSYYVIAFNGCGDAVHSDTVQAIVPPSLGQVLGLTATADSCACSYLSWQTLSGATSYQIFCGQTLLATQNAPDTTYSDCVVPPTTCSYTVRGVNACGNGLASDAVVGIKLTPPGIVQNFDATDTNCDSIMVTWLVEANVDSYIINYFEGPALDTLIAPDIQQPWVDHPNCGTYTYQISARNECGLSDPGPSANGTRPCPPGQVQNVQATDNSCTNVTVSWNALTGALEYYIYRDGDPIDSVLAPTVTYNDAPAPGTYEYCLQARNVCGYGAQIGLCDNGTRLAVPTIPTNVHADDGCGVITVFWDASTGDVDNYAIRRDGGAPVFDNASPYPDDTATPGPHSYTVEAISNECNDSGQSPADNGINDVVPPPPTGLAASNNNCDTISVTWTQGVTAGFSIYRDGTYVGHRDDDEPSYDDTTVTNNLNHTYTIRALSGPICDDSSAFSTGAVGSLVDLLTANSIIPDTVYCDSTYDVDYDLCPDIDSIRVFLSVNGGAYTQYGTIPTPTVITQVTIPHPNNADNPNSHLRFISCRGIRRDTLTTNPFLLDCNLGIVDGGAGVPEEFYLAQNYPNPFNPTTTIEFGVPKLSYISIEIYDLGGRLVATPLSGLVEPGIRMITWDCSECATGMYLLRMTTEAGILQKKMLLMK